jgi:hypothetical protein
VSDRPPYVRTEARNLEAGQYVLRQQVDLATGEWTDVVDRVESTRRVSGGVIALHLRDGGRSYPRPTEPYLILTDPPPEEPADA